MTIQKRSLKVEKLARIYDDEIGPVWGSRFGKMILRNLRVPERGQVLEISCGTGWPTVEILRRMGEGARLIAIDASSAMLDVARKKVQALGPLGKKGVFFRTESPIPRLSFADDVYDLVVCNLGLEEMPSVDSALADFARVCKMGGEVRCTVPLAGTFQEWKETLVGALIDRGGAAGGREALELATATATALPESQVWQVLLADAHWEVAQHEDRAAHVRAARDLLADLERTGRLGFEQRELVRAVRGR